MSIERVEILPGQHITIPGSHNKIKVAKVRLCMLAKEIQSMASARDWVALCFELNKVEEIELNSVDIIIMILLLPHEMIWAQRDATTTP